MALWRISNHAILDGFGGLCAGARWHSRGRRVVYFAETPAGAFIEVLVHLELPVDSLPVSYRLLKVDTAVDVTRESMDAGGLPQEWRERLTLTRSIGDTWLQRGSSALLEVPSAIVPETSNWLFNPEHREASKVSVAWHREFAFDTRFLRVR